MRRYRSTPGTTIETRRSTAPRSPTPRKRTRRPRTTRRPTSRGRLSVGPVSHVRTPGKPPCKRQGGKLKMGQSHRIADLMTQNPRTITPDSSVADAAKMMRDDDVGLLPVADGDRLVGTLTDRDVAIRVVAEGRDPDSTKVNEVASTDLVTIDPEQTLDEALRLMAQHQVRRLPVVEEDGKLVGIVAQADVARHGDDSQTGQVVERISQ